MFSQPLNTSLVEEMVNEFSQNVVKAYQQYLADLNAAVSKNITPQMQEAYKKTGAAQVVKLSAKDSHKLAL